MEAGGSRRSGGPLSIRCKRRRRIIARAREATLGASSTWAPPVALQPETIEHGARRGYQAHTFDVCKGHRKVGLCLGVDLAADADHEHRQAWCTYLEALAELNPRAQRCVHAPTVIVSWCVGERFLTHLQKRRPTTGRSGQEVMENATTSRTSRFSSLTYMTTIHTPRIMLAMTNHTG